MTKKILFYVYDAFRMNTGHSPLPYKKYDLVYTFVKDKNITSCKVTLESSSGEPLYRHKCYNVTGLDR